MAIDRNLSEQDDFEDIDDLADGDSAIDEEADSGEDYSEEDSADGETWDASDEQEESDDGDSGEEPPAKNKKKKPLKQGGKNSTNIIIIAGAVGILGLGAVYLMGSGAPAPQPVPEEVAAAPQAAPESMPPQPFPSQTDEVKEEPSGGLLNNPGALEAMQRQQGGGEAAQAVPVEAGDGSGIPSPAPALEQPPVLTPLPGESAPESQDLSSTASSAAVAEHALAQDNPVTLPTAQDITLKSPDHTQPASLSSPDIKNIEEKLEILIGRLDGVESRIGNLDKAMADLSVEKTSETASTSSADVEALKETISKLEKKIDAMDQVKPAGTVKITKPAKAVEEDPFEREFGESSGESVVSTAKSAGETPAEKSGNPWILRSAGSGQAMLSRGADGDMIKVEEGHSLPGLGKILSIRNLNGRWVVEGTNGTVTN